MILMNVRGPARRLMIGMLISAAVFCRGTADASTLEIGIWPYMSTQALLTLYHPMQRYLQEKLQRPVLFVTAPDQRIFVARTQAGQYRFLITAPHFARLAQKEAGYVPLLRAARDSVTVFIVRKGGNFSSLSDLRGKTITMPSKLTMISILGLWKLKESGLVPGRDVSIRYAVSHNSAALDVLRGNSAAAVVGATILDQMPDRAKFRVLVEAGTTPPLIVLANRNVPEEEADKMKRLILDFSENTPEGRQFIEKGGYKGFKEPSKGDMKRLDPVVAELEKLLKESR